MRVMWWPVRVPPERDPTSTGVLFFAYVQSTRIGVQNEKASSPMQLPHPQEFSTVHQLEFNMKGNGSDF